MPFLVFAFVQGDKTKEAIQEIYREIAEFTTTKPATDEEIGKCILNKTLELPGSWETNDAVTNSISEIVNYDLKDNYFDTYVKRIKSINSSEISEVAKEVLFPDKLVWVVVGDKAAIYNPLKELGYEIKVIDTDGKIITE